MYDNMGYGYGQPKIPRVTSAMVEHQIAMMLGNPNLTFTKLKEPPEGAMIKHACVPTGVCVLPCSDFMLFACRVLFAVCPQCGKVVYYMEDMGGV